MLAFQKFHGVDRLLHGAHILSNVFALVAQKVNTPPFEAFEEKS